MHFLAQKWKEKSMNGHSALLQNGELCDSISIRFGNLECVGFRLTSSNTQRSPKMHEFQDDFPYLLLFRQRKRGRHFFYRYNSTHLTQDCNDAQTQITQGCNKGEQFALKTRSLSQFRYSNHFRIFI